MLYSNRRQLWIGPSALCFLSSVYLGLRPRLVYVAPLALFRGRL
jgi:hypothetical protein